MRRKGFTGGGEVSVDSDHSKLDQTGGSEMPSKVKINLTLHVELKGSI